MEGEEEAKLGNAGGVSLNPRCGRVLFPSHYQKKGERLGKMRGVLATRATKGDIKTDVFLAHFAP